MMWIYPNFLDVESLLRGVLLTLSVKKDRKVEDENYREVERQSPPPHHNAQDIDTAER